MTFKAALATSLALSISLIAPPKAMAEDWVSITATARGQTVYFNAWGGDQRTNEFLAKVGEIALADYGVTLVQVKLDDTAVAVNRVLTEKAAGETEAGSIDLIWINGPNFRAMKEQDLLFGPFVANLPNAALVDLAPGAPASLDFTIPVEGYESPWRLARFVFQYDQARLEQPPKTLAELAEFARANPGRFTHPSVNNFMGATFLKQVLVTLVEDKNLLARAPTEAEFAAATAPVWEYYDALRPNLWRGGAQWPENASILEQMLADGEVDIAMSFDPASAAAAIRQGILPGTVRTFALDGGMIGNVSFVAIPFNSPHKEGAQVIANLLLDPKVQAMAQNIDVLGAWSVLDPVRLDAGAQAAFAALPSDPALPGLADLGPTLAEPHPDWMVMLSAEFARRYGS